MTFCIDCSNLNPDGTCKANVQQWSEVYPPRSLRTNCFEFRSVWKKARKKPVVVLFREVISKQEQIETLESKGHEGILTAHAEQDFIIRGVNGEEYPIKKDIFYKTYEVGDALNLAEVLEKVRDRFREHDILDQSCFSGSKQVWSADACFAELLSVLYRTGKRKEPLEVQ
jgi:hypothetical protein